MTINFYPERNDPKLEKAAKEYQQIWRKEGDKIIRSFKKISGLKFKEKIINAVIYNNSSYSIPLQLEASLSRENKKAAIIHELCHRIAVGNNLQFGKLPKNKFNWNIAVHKPVMLILYDLWIDLYSEDFAKKAVEYESLQKPNKKSSYKVTWDWALKMTREQRQKEFRKYFKK